MRQRFLTQFTAQSRWFGIGGLLTVILAALGLAGLPGLVLGGILALSWLRLPPEYTFTLGQFALVVATPTQQFLRGGGTPSLGLLALGELGLLGLLLTAPSELQRQGRTGVGVTASIVAVGLAVSWWSVTTGVALWMVGSGVIAVGGSLVYLVQAYDRWQLPQPPARSGVDHE